MSDLISRSWLLDVFELVPWDTEKDRNRAIHHVRELAPSAQPYSEGEIQTMQDLEQAQFDKMYELGKQSAQPEWIPCSERLPETDDHVLVTTINKKGERRVVRAYYYHSDDYPGGGAWAAGMNNNVIAWMEMPEPYGGEA